MGVAGLLTGQDEPAGGVACRCSDVAAPPSEQVGPVPAEFGELPLDGGEFEARVGWDGGGDGVPLRLEAGVVEGGAHPGRSTVVLFDGEGFGGRGPGVDGPAGAVVDGPVTSEVVGGLAEVVGEER